MQNMLRRLVIAVLVLALTSTLAVADTPDFLLDLDFGGGLGMVSSADSKATAANGFGTSFQLAPLVVLNDRLSIGPYVNRSDSSHGLDGEFTQNLDVSQWGFGVLVRGTYKSFSLESQSGYVIGDWDEDPNARLDGDISGFQLGLGAFYGFSYDANWKGAPTFEVGPFAMLDLYDLEDGSSETRILAGAKLKMTFDPMLIWALLFWTLPSS